MGANKTAVSWFFFSVFFVQSCYSNDGEPPSAGGVETHFQSEISDIERYSDSGEKEGIFLFKIFKHLIPMPNRYVLIARAKCRKEFNSLGFISGFIRVGELSENSFQIDSDKYKEIEYSESSMDVTIYKSTFTKPGLDQIIISDNEFYLLIQDQNPGLWKAMLRAAKKTAVPEGAEFLYE